MNRGLGGLEERVLSQGLCTVCGACLSLCPYLRSYRGRVVKIHDCNLQEGRCFAYCPRVETQLEDLEGKDGEIGPFRKVIMARARDPLLKGRAQSGGTVSALIEFAMRRKVIDAALLTSRDGNLPPTGRIVRNPEEIRNYAGSTYISGPTLEAIHKGPWQEAERIVVVGLPCQVQALSKMRSHSHEKKTPVHHIRLVIGLFCTWALEYERFQDFLKARAGGRVVTRLEITPPPERLLKISFEEDLETVPVDEIRSFIRKGCQVCPEMTAERSDISAGTVEGMEGWNTVVLRSDLGEKLFEEAEAEGLLESQPLPQDHLTHLKEASLLKKERALNNLKVQEGSNE